MHLNNLTFSTTKRGTDLGTLVVPFLPIHPLHMSPNSLMKVYYNEISGWQIPQILNCWETLM